MTSIIKQSDNKLFERDELHLTEVSDLTLVQRDGRALKYVKGQTPEICLAAVQEDGRALEHVRVQTPEICLAAAQQDGWALQFVKNQTPEICLAAAQQDGWALQFVKNQTPEICLAAVQEYGRALEYVRVQTPEICLAAAQQDGWALRFIKNRTPEICLVALEQTPRAFEVIDSDILEQFQKEGTLAIKQLEAKDNARNVKAYHFEGNWYFFVGCQQGISKERFIYLIHENGGLENHPHRRYYLNFLVECSA